MYRQLIEQATGVTDTHDLAEIEEILRGMNGGVLDHLTAEEFADQAKLANKVRAEMSSKGSW